MSNCNIFKSGGGGSVESWKDPAIDVASLPASDNTEGDIRQTLDSGDLHRWNGASWDLYFDSSESGDYVTGPASAVDDNIATFDATTGKIIQDGGQTITEVIAAAVAGSGDVVGPASASDNAITRYDSTTGKLVQDSTSHLDDEGDLRLGSDSAPDASAILDLSSTTKGFKGPSMTEAQRDAIGSPATSLLVYNTDTDELNIYNGTAWIAVGTATLDPKQFIIGDNRSFDISIGAWAAYADAAGTEPVDGTGGSPTVTITQTGTTPLVGSGMGVITKDAANRQGEGISLSSIAVPDGYEGLPLKVSVIAEPSANYVANDIIGFIYDETNTNLIGSIYNADSGGIQTGKQVFEGLVYPATDTASIRLIWHIATTNAAAYTVNIDEVQLEWVPYVLLPNSGIWKDGGTITIGATTTAPTKGTIVTDQVKYQITGPNGNFSYQYDQSSSAGAGSGDYLFTLPGGLKFDSNNIQYDTTAVGVGGWQPKGSIIGTYSCGIGTGADDLSALGVAIAYDSTRFRCFYISGQGTSENVGVGAFSSGGIGLFANRPFSIQLNNVPLEGRSANTTEAMAINSGLHKTSVSRASTSQTIASSAQTTLIYNNIIYGTSANFNIATGVWTCPRSSWYNFQASAKVSSLTANELLVMRVTAGGATVARQESANANTSWSIGAVRNNVYLEAGDTASVSLDSVSDTSYNFNSDSAITFDISEVPFSQTALFSNTGDVISSGSESTTAWVPSANQWGDLTSITLTPGEWILNARYGITSTSGAINAIYELLIGTVSGNSGTGLISMVNFVRGSQLPYTGCKKTIAIDGYIVNISSNTTYYLKNKSDIVTNVSSDAYFIQARRLRY